MNYQLTLREDTLRGEDGECHTVYGLNVICGQDAVLAFPDIAFDKAAVLRLIRLCEQEQVELCHLRDVIYDTIVEQYL